MAAPPHMRPAYTFDLRGGRLCLDFANTVSDRGTDTPADHLASYDDFLAWASQAGAVTRSVAAVLARLAASRPADARAALNRATDLREAIYRVFAAVALGGSPRADDLRALNEQVPRAFSRSRLAAAEEGYVLTSDAPPDDLSGPLIPVMRSAVDLLTSRDLARIRVCAASACMDRSICSSLPGCAPK